MMALRFLLTAVVLAAPHLSATVIGFDDLDASAGDVVLDSSNPYQGFDWTNFSVYTSVPGFPGFNNGIVSPANAAYSGGELLGNAVQGQVTAISPFDFTSVSLGAGYYDNLSITVQGFLGGTQYDSQTVTVGTSGAQPFSFNFGGIDTLVFSAAATAASSDPYNCGAVNCTQFTLDDIVLTPGSTVVPPPPSSPPPSSTPSPNTPEPSAMALFALGGLALFSLRRSRRSASNPFPTVHP